MPPEGDAPRNQPGAADEQQARHVPDEALPAEQQTLQPAADGERYEEHAQPEKRPGAVDVQERLQNGGESHDQNQQHGAESEHGTTRGDALG